MLRLNKTEEKNNELLKGIYMKKIFGLFISFLLTASRFNVFANDIKVVTEFSGGNRATIILMEAGEKHPGIYLWAKRMFKLGNSEQKENLKRINGFIIRSNSPLYSKVYDIVNAITPLIIQAEEFEYEGKISDLRQVKQLLIEKEKFLEMILFKSI